MVVLMESLWLHYRDEPALSNNNNIIEFSANDNNSILFKFKQQVTVQIGKRVPTDVEAMVPLKHLSNFWRTLKMPYLLIVKLIFS